MDLGQSTVRSTEFGQRTVGFDDFPNELLMDLEASVQKLEMFI